MSQMSRRNVLTASAVLAGAVLPAWPRVTVEAAQADQGGSGTNPAFSPDLHLWAADNISQMVHHVRAGTVTAEHMSACAGDLRLYARHINSISAQQSKYAITRTQAKFLQQPTPFGTALSNAHQRLVAQNPDLTEGAFVTALDELPHPSTGTPQQVLPLTFAQSLHQIADHFEGFSDIVRAGSKSQSIQPAYVRATPTLPQSLLYSYGAHQAHLQRACHINIPTGKQICAGLAAAAAGAGGLRVWLESGWTIFFNILTATAAGDSAALSAAMATYSAATPTVQLAVDALLFAADTSAFGPEALTLGLGAIAIGVGVIAVYCAIST